SHGRMLLILPVVRHFGSSDHFHKHPMMTMRRTHHFCYSSVFCRGTMISPFMYERYILLLNNFLCGMRGCYYS
ncbi:hypothetical protein DFH94DRAFT_773869, partial [Russula ochroleuca]